MHSSRNAWFAYPSTVYTVSFCRRAGLCARYRNIGRCHCSERSYVLLVNNEARVLCRVFTVRPMQGLSYAQVPSMDMHERCRRCSYFFYTKSPTSVGRAVCLLPYFAQCRGAVDLIHIISCSCFVAQNAARRSDRGCFLHLLAPRPLQSTKGTARLVPSQGQKECVVFLFFFFPSG